MLGCDGRDTAEQQLRTLDQVFSSGAMGGSGLFRSTSGWIAHRVELPIYFEGAPAFGSDKARTLEAEMLDFGAGCRSALTSITLPRGQLNHRSWPMVGI